MACEYQIFSKWIQEKWGTCYELRGKISWEGARYFYDSYTEVPVSKGVYYEFVNAIDPAGDYREYKRTCYCGQCDMRLRKIPVCDCDQCIGAL